MIQNRSFKDYTKQKFHNEIWAVDETFFKINTSNIKRFPSSLHRIGNIEITEV